MGTESLEERLRAATMADPTAAWSACVVPSTDIAPPLLIARWGFRVFRPRPGLGSIQASLFANCLSCIRSAGASADTYTRACTCV